MNLRTLSPLLIAAAVAACAPSAAFAQSTRPAEGMAGGMSDSPATQPGGRAYPAIEADLAQVSQQISAQMTGPDSLLTAEGRKGNAEAVVPLLKKMDSLMAEAAPVVPPEDLPSLKSQQYSTKAMLVAYGDQETKQSLEGEGTPAAKGAMLLGRFVGAEDASAKQSVVDDLSKLADAEPQDPAVLESTVQMLQLAQDPEVMSSLKTVVSDKLQGPMAEQLQKQMAAQDAQMAEQEKAAMAFKENFLNKPLTVESQTLEGKSFTTDDLKGKVVMVDFWATWCGPCIASLPDLKAEYKKYHDQGLEVVGVSLDQSAEPLKAFLSKNPDMTWTQLFTVGDPDATQKISTGLGIEGIPTVFLLDRNGVVRDLAVGTGPELDKLRDMVPELLKEEASASPTTKPAE